MPRSLIVWRVAVENSLTNPPMRHGTKTLDQVQVGLVLQANSLHAWGLPNGSAGEIAVSGQFCRSRLNAPYILVV